MSNVDALSSVASNLGALTAQYRAIANNLANCNTTGFKRQVSSFENILKNTMDGSGKVRAVNNKISFDFGQGSLTQTGRNMDLAIEGEGFFTINTQQGPVYTRNGTFSTNANGNLVDRLGRVVASESGTITIPSEVNIKDVHVGRDGSVSANGQQLGKLKIVKFEKPGALKAMGGGAYKAPPKERPVAATGITVVQGSTERSNVNAIEELVNLIRVSRLYEANVKSINQYDEKMDSLLRVANS